MLKAHGVRAISRGLREDMDEEPFLISRVIVMPYASRHDNILQRYPLQPRSRQPTEMGGVPNWEPKDPSLIAALRQHLEKELKKELEGVAKMITLKTLKSASLRDIFDKRRSTCSHRWLCHGTTLLGFDLLRIVQETCAYRGVGLKCVVGCFMEDDEYGPEFEGIVGGLPDDGHLAQYGSDHLGQRTTLLLGCSGIFNPFTTTHYQ